MSLDETRKRLEELKRLEEEKKKRKKERAKRSPEDGGGGREPRSPKGGQIQGKIGSVAISFTPELLDQMLAKIWTLDNLQNPGLDHALLDSIQAHPGDFALPLDAQKFFVKARENVFFKLSDQKRIGYQEFRQTWQQYCGPGMEVEFHPRRMEFTQLFTNRYKWRWVDAAGAPLSEGMFQMLYRIEREPKALERLVGLLQENYLAIASGPELQAFLAGLRARIARLIKEDLLNLMQPNGLPGDAGKFPAGHPARKRSPAPSRDAAEPEEDDGLEEDDDEDDPDV